MHDECLGRRGWGGGAGLGTTRIYAAPLSRSSPYWLMGAMICYGCVHFWSSCTCAHCYPPTSDPCRCTGNRHALPLIVRGLFTPPTTKAPTLLEEVLTLATSKT